MLVLHGLPTFYFVLLDLSSRSKISNLDVEDASRCWTEKKFPEETTSENVNHMPSVQNGEHEFNLEIKNTN